MVFDHVKFEKAKAIVRYNRFRKVVIFLQFLEVFVALVLISWSFTRLPLAVKISGEILFEVSNYLFNPHVVFVIGNVIIVALFVLRRENGGGSEDSSDSDLYDGYIRHSDAHDQRPKVLASEGEKITVAEPLPTREEKQIVVSSPETEEKSESLDPVTRAIEKATKQIEKFQRTQSVKLKREIAVKPRAELRRSETLKVGREEMTSFDTVDKLSNEEFKLTIEAVIKRHQEFLMEQKLAEKRELNNYLRKNFRCASVR